MYALGPSAATVLLVFEHFSSKIYQPLWNFQQSFVLADAMKFNNFKKMGLLPILLPLGSLLAGGVSFHLDSEMLSEGW
jgi:hypothetical protein